LDRFDKVRGGVFSANIARGRDFVTAFAFKNAA
jgi:hypothetical protein